MFMNNKTVTGSIPYGSSPHTPYAIPRTPAETPYDEAIRYMDNANDNLKKANKRNGFYDDKKYVRTACGIAYNAVLISLDALLEQRGVKLKKGKRKSIEYYILHIAKIDRKLLNELNSVYTILHLNGYYDGLQDARVIARGFELAYKIIRRIQPK
ncbi:MAG: hypothetical protein MdMp024_1724 [Bacteroidales bacterium]